MNLKYGHDTIDIDLPNHINWQILDKRHDQIKNENEIIQNTIDQTVTRIKKSGSHKILIIIPDHTRYCKLEIILPLLLKELGSFSVEFLVANGSHKIQKDSVIEDIVGSSIFDNYKITQHDCQNDEHFFAGKTRFGTDIYLNKKIKDADMVLTISATAFHYFAGFGGGPKMLLPGIASFESIKANHSRTINFDGRFHPNCKIGLIQDNPIIQEIIETSNFLPDILSFQIVLNEHYQVVQAELGNIVDAYIKTHKSVRDLFSVSIDKKFDVIVASAGGAPWDVNIIQTHKTIYNAIQAVKPGGTLIVLAQCKEGVGSVTFLNHIKNTTAIELGKNLVKNYQLNGQTALSLKEKSEHVKINLVSDLNDEVVREAGLIPAKNVKGIFSELPPGSNGAIIKNGAKFVPLLGQ